MWWNLVIIMRPSSLGGGRILRRTVCLSVCLSVRPVIVSVSVTSRHLANYNDTHVLFGTRWGPHIVRPSRPHRFLFHYTFTSESDGENKFENRSKFDKVMSKSRASCFLYIHGELPLPLVLNSLFVNWPNIQWSLVRRGPWKSTFGDCSVRLFTWSNLCLCVVILCPAFVS